ncbi:hypothetical protein HZP50_06985 [Elizabethkingia anophelis]|uniref:Uncharacterized protein n=1 Tax=Elizabethkingia miricola TaxID=172045 RepID=A0ABY3NAG4_ELIMR|nr:hypothetical protein [Elizabethkingia miricola]MCT4190235.1 hypothetical protein [Elizabethkingia anophelis]MCT4287369.1 hypothetical protein [Elizabethkingia anophelis]TYO84188.1 hypothetical protein LX74_03987 [Elizabethkingia miricola]
MKNKTQTKKEAIALKKRLIQEGKTDIHIYKFAGKRKWQYFVGDWWQWLGLIS